MCADSASKTPYILFKIGECRKIGLDFFSKKYSDVKDLKVKDIYLGENTHLRLCQEELGTGVANRTCCVICMCCAWVVLIFCMCDFQFSYGSPLIKEISAAVLLEA